MLGLGASAVLAGCARRPAEGPRPARPGQAGQSTGAAARPASASTPDARAVPITRRPHGWSDDKPVDWPGRRPDAYAVHGVDVARYQGTIDWPAAARSGVSFAFVKATEGGDLADPMLDANLRGARAAGVPVGAYHFYYFCTAPEVQARWFIANVARARIDLPPVLDLEWNAHSPTCRLRPPGPEVRAAAARFIALVSDHYRQRPIIYTTPDFWDDTDIRRLGGEFWLRSVARHPAERYPGARWTFWQYSGTGRVPGAGTRIDLNAFNGSPADWQAWYARRRLV